VIFILILSNVFLNIVTRHGKSLPLPDFGRKTLDSVLIIARANDLRIEVTDSVFRYDFPKGAVLMQNPEAGIHVKKNRKVFLTINALSQKKESVPNVTGMSLRQAKTAFAAKGFKVGALNYDPSDYATNNVLRQTYKGDNIEPGTLLPTGEYIDLKLGLDTTALATVSVPEVTGLMKSTAEDLIVDNSLNYQHVFDANIKNLTDSLNSIVYKQEPETGTHSYYGRTVKIWLKLSRNKSKSQ
jgi:beta-lactam-binding protein with PASTA domain